jgi:hypothetical protein
MERRLAAILAADVVGFGRLMHANEAGTLAARKARRSEILQPLVRYRNRPGAGRGHVDRPKEARCGSEPRALVRCAPGGGASGSFGGARLDTCLYPGLVLVGPNGTLPRRHYGRTQRVRATFCDRARRCVGALHHRRHLVGETVPPCCCLVVSRTTAPRERRWTACAGVLQGNFDRRHLARQPAAARANARAVCQSGS